MRVAHIIASADPKFGGGTIAFRELTAACARAGVNVHQFFTLTRQFDVRNLQVADMPIPCTVVRRESGDSWGAAIDLCRVLRAEHERQSFDLIHIHGIWLPLVVATAWWAGLLQIPVVTSTHGMLLPWAFSFKRSKKLLAWWLYQRWLLQDCACLHATSDVERAEAARLGLKAPVAVVPLGIGALPREAKPITQLGDGPRGVLYLGRLHPVKNLPSLIKAWASKPRHGWQLHLVGPEEEGHRVELERQVAEAGLQGSILFHGAANEAAKWDWIERCEVLVLPSFSENFGIVVAEALAMSRPVIASRGAPWSDLLKHRCGWWCESSVEGLQGALDDALAMSREQLAEHGERGRALVESSYLWSKTGASLSQLYRSILDSGAPRPAFVSGRAFRVPNSVQRARLRRNEVQDASRASSSAGDKPTRGRRIAIVTFYRAHNYGAVLQAYALQEALKALGAQPFFVDYDPDYVERGGAWELPVSRWALRANLVNGWLRYTHWKELLFSKSKRRAMYAKFHADFMSRSPRKYRSIEELRSDPPEADAFVSGSDQVWNPTTLYGIDRAFLLDFGPAKTPRYSYAASFGRGSIEEQYAPVLREHLPRFNRISVREESGVQIVSRMSGCSARCDPDPTLLVDAFDRVTASIVREKPFLFCYILRSAKSLPVMLDRLSRILGAEVVSAWNPQQRWRLPGATVDCGPSEWLGHIRSAKFVVTNSYHGTIFSILFRRPFVTVGLSAEKASLNERAKTLLGKLGLSDRLVVDPSEEELRHLAETPPDWDEVAARLAALRLSAQDHLRELAGIQAE